jgi:histidinol-phosphate/aromatic aminotransferase/cobyric acid decarboxylase-like protein
VAPRARPELEALAPAAHGGDAAPDALDFSTGISPLAPPEAVLRAFREARLDRYPHPTARPLALELARAHDRGVDEIVAGAGSVELIWALARAFVGPGRTALVAAPAFGEYAQAVRASGGRVVEVRAAELEPHREADLLRALDEARPELAFLCRPSNPCLHALSAETIDALARRAPRTLFVVDEAYLPLFDGVAPIAARKNVAVMRSLTKVFALAGLRVGYLVAEAPIARAVQAALPPWNVSAPAQAAGIEAVRALDTAPSVRREVARLRRALSQTLVEARVPVDAEGGPFVLARVGDATRVATALAARGLRVRDCTSFGLPAHLRLGARPEAEQARLVPALVEVLR